MLNKSCFYSHTCLFYIIVAIKDKTNVGFLTDNETELKEPEDYRVILLNDDYTTMEFVVAVIISVFQKSMIEATRIMLDVHQKGRGIVGIYCYDIAVSKISRVHAIAKENGYPLKCTMEKA